METALPCPEPMPRRAPQERREDSTRPVGAADCAEPAQPTWRAGLPLAHSTLVPASMRALQQGQIVENLAVMVMVGSGGRRWFVRREIQYTDIRAAVNSCIRDIRTDVQWSHSGASLLETDQREFRHETAPRLWLDHPQDRVSPPPGAALPQRARYSPCDAR